VTEDLLRRLRRADPARDLSASSSSVRDLMEAAMQSTPTHSTPTESMPRGTRADSPARLSRRWPVAAAAAVATLVIGGAGAAFLAGDGSPATPPTPPAASVMELTLPGSDVMSSCIQYSVEFLAQMPVAFSGEVVEADAGTVVLDVDRWYRGGDADTVALLNPSGQMTSIDGVELVAGRRYLVTASEDGTVNSCGFTAEWSPAMAADFERAFAD